MNERICTFYLVRHGESYSNVKQKLQGHKNSRLTNEGINQAKLIAKELKSINFDFAFSSDLLRAKKTAEIIAIEHKLLVKTSELLRERNFGKWEGKPYNVYSTELKHLLDEFLELSDKEKKKYKFPDMESDEEIVIRLITFLRETALAYAGKTILIGTHGSIMRAFLIHLGFGTYDEIPADAVSNCGYMKIESDGNEFFLKEVKGIKKIKN